MASIHRWEYEHWGRHWQTISGSRDQPVVDTRGTCNVAAKLIGWQPAPNGMSKRTVIGWYLTPSPYCLLQTLEIHFSPVSQLLYLPPPLSSRLTNPSSSSSFSQTPRKKTLLKVTITQRGSTAFRFFRFYLIVGAILFLLRSYEFIERIEESYIHLYHGRSSCRILA